jgi:hypothetical protein
MTPEQTALAGVAMALLFPPFIIAMLIATATERHARIIQYPMAALMAFPWAVLVLAAPRILSTLI